MSLVVSSFLMFIICMPHRILNPHPKNTLVTTLVQQIFIDCMPCVWLLCVEENDSLKDKERRKNCLWLWKIKEEKGGGGVLRCPFLDPPHYE